MSNEFVENINAKVKYDVLILLSGYENEGIEICQKESLGDEIPQFLKEVDKISKGGLVKGEEKGPHYTYYPSALISRIEVAEQLANYLKSKDWKVFLNFQPQSHDATELL